MYPGLATTAKSIYWGIRRNPANMGHRCAVLLRSLKSVVLFWILRLCHPRHKLVVISLIESMGDIIAAEPVSRAAREQYPDAFIVWLVRPVFVEMVERFPCVDKGFAVTCLTEAMVLLSLRPTSVLWNLHVSNALCNRCRAPLPKHGPAAKITLDSYLDFGNLLQISCLCAGIQPINQAPRFDPGPIACAAVDALDLPSSFVVLHCTSNDRNRNWRDESWDEVANYVNETLGWQIVEVGLAPVTQGAKSGRYRNLCGKVSIPAMGEVIRRASLFIGVDSGPSHIGNAVGTPGVLLFGRYGRWDNYLPHSGPYQDGSGADLLRQPGPLKDLPVAMVKEAARRRVGFAAGFTAGHASASADA